MAFCFVILPDQLFHTIDAIDNLLLCDQIYLMEDPVFFNPTFSRSKLVMHRASMKEYQAWIQASLDASKAKSKKLPIVHYINYERIHEKGATIFDYLIGVGMQVWMYRPSNTWAYGETMWKYTYAGLPIKFYESKGFLLTYRSIRDNCKPNTRYQVDKIALMTMNAIKLPAAIKNAVAGLDAIISHTSVNPGCISKFPMNDKIKNACDYVSGISTDNANPRSQLIRYCTNWNEATELKNRFLAQVLPGYTTGDIKCISPAMNIGLLTPGELINSVLTLFDTNRSSALAESIARFLYDISYREYLRLLYLADDKFPSKSLLGDVTCRINSHPLIVTNCILHLQQGCVVSDSVLKTLITYYTVIGKSSDLVGLLKMSSDMYDWNTYSIIPSFCNNVSSIKYDFSKRISNTSNYIECMTAFAIKNNIKLS
jgi:deoxyribodipyrimidine photolyase-like uncharacterized protein